MSKRIRYFVCSECNQTQKSITNIMVPGNAEIMVVPCVDCLNWSETRKFPIQLFDIEGFLTVQFYTFYDYATWRDTAIKAEERGEHIP